MLIESMRYEVRYFCSFNEIEFFYFPYIIYSVYIQNKKGLAFGIAESSPLIGIYNGRPYSRSGFKRVTSQSPVNLCARKQYPLYQPMWLVEVRFNKWFSLPRPISERVALLHFYSR